MVVIDYSRDGLLGEASLATLKGSYFKPYDTSPQQVFARTAEAVAVYNGQVDEGLAQRLYDYASKQWFMFSTPLLANAPFNEKALPISCYLMAVGDSINDLLEHGMEARRLSVAGGGCASYYGDVRRIGSRTSTNAVAPGPIPFIVDEAEGNDYYHAMRKEKTGKESDTEQDYFPTFLKGMVDENYGLLAFQQGGTRRGKTAFYLPVWHPEITEFLKISDKRTGDASRRVRNNFTAVCIDDAFMQALAREDDTYFLVDPHTKEQTGIIQARELWQEILTARMKDGFPYIMYTDTCNDARPVEHVKAGYTLKQSNLCSEVVLPTTPDRTAVCCLSSVNLEKFDEWKADPQFIPDLITMLDNALDIFVRTQYRLPNAALSVLAERALGLGAMGWHSYLQKNDIAFEDKEALLALRAVHSHIKKQALATTIKLAKERGPCGDSAKYGGGEKRNLYLTAIAPNATSSIICGNVSPSIEPYSSNYFSQETQNFKRGAKNNYLKNRLEALGKNTPEVWASIGKNRGSVQHLDFLSEHDKRVFKTAKEIDQRHLIVQASARQEYLCQSQSLNLFFDAQASKEYVHAVHYLSWVLKVKTLYYVRSNSVQQVSTDTLRVEQTTQAHRLGLIDEDGPEECLACEG